MIHRGLLVAMPARDEGKIWCKAQELPGEEILFVGDYLWIQAVYVLPGRAVPDRNAASFLSPSQ